MPAVSLKKTVASALTAAIILGTCGVPPAAAQSSSLAAGRAANAAAPGFGAAARFSPAPAAWRPAFQGLSRWLASPEGRAVLLEVRPDLGGLSWAASRDSAGLVFGQLVGPLAAGQDQARLKAALAGVAALSKDEQRAVVSRIGGATDEAAPAVTRRLGELREALSSGNASVEDVPGGLPSVDALAVFGFDAAAAVQDLKADHAGRRLDSARRKAAALAAGSPAEPSAPPEGVAALAGEPAGAGLPSGWRLAAPLGAPLAAPLAADVRGSAPYAVERRRPSARSLARAAALMDRPFLSAALLGLAATAVIASVLAANPAGLLLASVPILAAVNGAARPLAATELLQQLSSKYVTGSAVDPAVESDPRTEAALRELEEQGVLLPLADGRRLFLDFATRASGSGSLKTVNRLGQAAAALLAKPGSEDIAIGLLKDAVLRLTAEPETGPAVAAYSQLSVLAANAASRLWASARADGMAPAGFTLAPGWRERMQALHESAVEAMKRSEAEGGTLHRSLAARLAVETLARASESPKFASAPESRSESASLKLPSLGVTVGPVDDAERIGLGLREGQGVVVTQVDPKGPAGEQGWQAGDVLASNPNGTAPIMGLEGFKNLVEAKAPPATLNFHAFRNGRGMGLSVVTKPGSPAASLKRQPIHALPPYLKNFAVNMSERAGEGKYDPVLGRDEEIQRVVTILGRRKKPNIILVGNPGVGKTSLVEGLAQWLAEHPESPLHKRNVISLNIGSMVSGTMLRGMFEERMQNVVRELREKPDQFIVFIDEIHNMMGAGSALGAPQDAAELLKPVLAGGEVLSIGATTEEELPLLEKDKAFLRRFQIERLKPPVPEEALKILRGVRPRYEAHHEVAVAEEALAAAVELGPRHFPDNSLPDSAIDLIDDAASTVRARALEAQREGRVVPSAVLAEDIYREVARRKDIPMGELMKGERSRLLALEDGLNARVVGQKAAAAKLAQAIRLARLGYKPADEPQGLFLFLGPTGVGKTEMARSLAELLFDSPDAMTRVDMSEYQHEGSINKLIGSGLGYVDSEEDGRLTGPVRKSPYRVVLLDEVDKAHPAVLNLLLQIAAGHLTDGRGRRVSFSNTVVIMTSNHGGSAGVKKRAVGLLEPKATTDPEAEHRARYLKAGMMALAPELIGRIGMDRMIVFNTLGLEEYRHILELRLAELNRTLKPKGMTVRLAAAAAAQAIKRALGLRTYGARPLRDVVNREVATAMADAELAGTIQRGDSVVVDVSPEGGYVAKPE